MTLITLGYIRVSTDQQAESGAGESAQRRSLEGASQGREWALELHTETGGASGKDLKRPVLQSLLALLDSGQAHCLAVAKLDRLSRSVVDFGLLLERARRGGWAIVALDLGVDTSTPTGELVANVMISVAQWERRIIGQRTREAMAAKAAEGVRMGGPVLISSDIEQRIVMQRAIGLSMSAIAQALSDDGIRTSKGASVWSTSTIQRVLNRHRQNAA